MARGRKKTQKEMKRANGTGGIRKLSGNRRKPFQAYVTVGTIEVEKLKFKQKTKSLGTFKTKEEAEEALDAYFKNPYEITGKEITFKKVYEEWSKRYFEGLKNNSSIRTITAAYKHSSALYNYVFTDITITMMKDVINHADVGAVTKNRMKSMFNLMYDFAVESQICSINLARQFVLKDLQNSIKRERKDKIPFNLKDEKKLWDNIDFGFTRMVLIGIYTGFRPIELCKLQISNINLEENYIIGGVKTEAGTDRYVPIHPKVYDLVKYCYEKSIEYNSDVLFFDIDRKKAKELTYDKYRGRFKKILEYNELSGYSPHCTRHTFITKAKEVNMNEYAIKMIAGHEIRDITENVYTHRDNEFLQKEMQKII